LLREIGARQRQAARLRVLGHRSADIARQLGVHKATITRWTQSEVFKREVDKLAKIADNSLMSPSTNDTHLRLIEAAATAVDVLVDILNDDRRDFQMTKLKKEAATEILSRAGFSPVKQVHIDQQLTSMSISAEAIARLKKRAMAVELPAPIETEVLK
jgi:transcriptional regulator with XRE-family HTH domain